MTAIEQAEQLKAVRRAELKAAENAQRRAAEEHAKNQIPM